MRRTLIVGVALSLLAAVSGHGAAQGIEPVDTTRWLKVGEGEGSGNAFYIDARTVRRDAAGRVVIWLLVTYTKPLTEPNGTSALYEKQRIVIDCTADRFQIRSWYGFDADGQEVAAREDQRDTWRYAIPETIQEGVVNSACRIGRVRAPESHRGRGP